MPPNDSQFDRASLAEMAAFPEMNPGPVIRTDDQGKILLVNAAARELFGSDGLRGRDWMDVCPGVERDLWRRVLDGADRLQHETQVNGRWFAFTYRRPTDVASVFIYGHDVTERKHAEQLLAERAAEVAEIARFPDMNPGPVIRTGHDGTIVLANAAALALFGAETLIGRCWKDVCPGMNDETWDRVLATTDVVRLETKVRDRFFMFAHRRATDGHLVFIFGTDITLLHAAEETVRQSEKMATLGVLAAGVAHELNNPAAAASRGADQLGAAFAKLQDAFVALSELHLSREQIGALSALVKEDRDHAAAASYIDPLTRSDLESNIETWLDDRGVIDSWELAPALVSLGYDTSELTRLADEWGDASGAVVGWLARAQPVLSLAREIEEATRRISEIVGALKTYSFLGQTPVRPVDVTEGIDNTLIIMRNKLKSGVNIVREYAAELPRIEAFGGELNQVWTNLIDNAVDAMKGKGTVTVRTRHDGDSVVIEIEDDGPGMPDSVRQCVFDPFFTTKEPGKGTGLGLATSRNVIVKRHGGTIDVESRPGRTTFIVRLPIHHSPNVAEAAPG